jgi:hypothetical protein
MLSMRIGVGKGLYCLLFGGARIGGGKLVGGRLERGLVLKEMGIYWEMHVHTDNRIPLPRLELIFLQMHGILKCLAVLVYITTAHKREISHMEPLGFKALDDMRVKFRSIRDNNEVSTREIFVAPAAFAGACADRSL